MQVIDGQSIEAVLIEWQSVIHKMATKIYVPGMEAEDVEQELLMTFVMAWGSYKPEEGPFENYLRVCLKYKATSLLRYGYNDGRRNTFTFTDLFGSDNHGDKLDRMLCTVNDAMSVRNVTNWRQILLDEATQLSTAHVHAAELFIARATAEDIAVASQAPGILYTSLIAEVLEEVRRKHFINNNTEED